MTLKHCEKSTDRTRDQGRNAGERLRIAEGVAPSRERGGDSTAEWWGGKKQTKDPKDSIHKSTLTGSGRSRRKNGVGGKLRQHHCRT